MSDSSAIPLTGDFCFCTIASGAPYREMALNLARDLREHAPGKQLYVYSDAPRAFHREENVVAFKYRQQSIARCSNDRRLLLASALVDYPTVVHLDADSRVESRLPDRVDARPGLSGRCANLADHIGVAGAHTRRRAIVLERAAERLDVSLLHVKKIWEPLYVISRDGGRESEFLDLWRKLAYFAELRGLHTGDGNLMGLAAEKVGWTICHTDTIRTLRAAVKHEAAHRRLKREEKTGWASFRQTLGRRYRHNRIRLAALRDVRFFYD